MTQRRGRTSKPTVSPIAESRRVRDRGQLRQNPLAAPQRDGSLWVDAHRLKPLADNIVQFDGSAQGLPVMRRLPVGPLHRLRQAFHPRKPRFVALTARPIQPLSHRSRQPDEPAGTRWVMSSFSHTGALETATSNGCYGVSAAWGRFTSQCVFLEAVPILSLIELRAARAGCCDARRRWLITDPLNYPEYQIPNSVAGGSPLLEVEVEFLTRPKQSGGTRLEILPDLATSTYLQAVANRLSERDLDLESSLSARIFSLQLKQENPYDVWSDNVPAWIRAELDDGRAVAIADIRDYYGSVDSTQIKTALRRPELEQATSDDAILLIEKLNSLPGPEGTTRSGIPVAPDEFFWLLGDLVLGPIDVALTGQPTVLSHMRWVDDYFLATSPGRVDCAVAQLAKILGERGFQLNEAKTRVFCSVEQFERATLAREHRIITDLFMAGAAGGLLAGQLGRLGDLVQREPRASIEENRLWRRLYALARRLKNPLLLDRALADLDRLPNAELPILGYLGAFSWRHPAAEKLGALLSAGGPDSRGLGMLRALLASEVDVPRELHPLLLNLVESPKSGLHPFCRVLAYGCLVKMRAAGRARSEATEALLHALGGLQSATARRVGIELLWLQPPLRQKLRKAITEDRSPVVRSLASLVDGRRENRKFVQLTARAPSLMDWDGLDTRLANAFGLPRGLD